MNRKSLGGAPRKPLSDKAYAMRALVACAVLVLLTGTALLSLFLKKVT